MINFFVCRMYYPFYSQILTMPVPDKIPVRNLLTLFPYRSKVLLPNSVLILLWAVAFGLWTTVPAYAELKNFQEADVRL